MMKLFKIGILLALVLSKTVCAQAQSGFAFKADKLNEISAEYAGSSSNWSIVTSLATYYVASNSFELDTKDVTILKSFKSSFDDFEKNRVLFQELVTKGALVFAPTESSLLDTMMVQYKQAIRDGEVEHAIDLSASITAQVNELKNVTEKNRVDRVSAILAEKTGNVERKKGLLGQWIESIVGELFQETDAVKTAKESFAKLDFVDGSYITLEPETIAQIKTANVDKLSKQTVTEVLVENGGLLSVLSAEAKRRSEVTIVAGNSTTTLASSKFWANKLNEGEVRLSNYDGTASVDVNNKTIQLQKNEGTVVVNGQEPLMPVKLLPSPKFQWSNTDSVTFDKNFTLKWNELAKATSYEVEMASDPDFTQNVKSLNSKTNRLTLKDLTEGIYYLRVKGYDALGLRGADSPTYRLLRNEDTQPPALFFKNGNELAYYTENEEYILSGITEPKVTIIVNESRFRSDDNGNFKITWPVIEEINKLEITATDPSGNITQISKQIIQIRQERFENIQWTVPVQGNEVTRSEEITISGRAYPPFEVTIETDKGFSRTVECDRSGQWAVTVQPALAQTITITYRYKQSQKTIFSKQFTLQ